ncbi:uncharacterized protein BO95DRAFT_445190 [Aspergillus brunneoviolaceus CBS 621.78]|uniref:Uncharacterized protein n=1 Tax=Aspergillus brunneoviolaceus CBS 621.78 TaxID=1450534 RepID=A0ACD1G299_9EURO|nr:hypothetical protein BO95DRAFT_445190 [Aspergillus brunneoviolaceus CBS 621.78]RAH43391.1 hypothetical protein BO95DRAFT_445190 [Aspergillus brunneoviolaceus CBS 621.78]
MDNALWAGNATNSSWENPACATDVQNFRRCMDENQGNMSICGWYLDQLVRYFPVFKLPFVTERYAGSMCGRDC